jgi:hypothetical protein
VGCAMGRGGVCSRDFRNGLKIETIRYLPRLSQAWLNHGNPSQVAYPRVK